MDIRQVAERYRAEAVRLKSASAVCGHAAQGGHDGDPHELTDRLFAVRRAFRVNDSLPAETVNATRWHCNAADGCSSAASRDESLNSTCRSLILSIQLPAGIAITLPIAASPKMEKKLYAMVVSVGRRSRF
jgi:hypothetical protein